jgi:hypothetical protein
MTGQNWVVVTDILLMLAVIIFTFKALRAPNAFRHSKRLGDLESSLRSLIREATTSGTTLNDELLVRKQELEKLLLELEQSGSRLMSSKESAVRILCDMREFEQRSSALRGELSALSQKAQSLSERLESAFQQGELSQAPVARSFAGSVTISHHSRTRSQKNDERTFETDAQPVLKSRIEKEVITKSTGKKSRSKRKEDHEVDHLFLSPTQGKNSRTKQTKPNFKTHSF